MKKRHLITLAIIATSIGCQKAELISDWDEDTRASEPQDTTNVDINTETEDWEGAIDVDFTITGTPSE